MVVKELLSMAPPQPFSSLQAVVEDLEHPEVLAMMVHGTVLGIANTRLSQVRCQPARLRAERQKVLVYVLRGLISDQEVDRVALAIVDTSPSWHKFTELL